MKYLLDTHALIWYANNDDQLSPSALSLITDPRNTCYISIASLWEMTIKSSLGKLDLKTGIGNFAMLALQNGIRVTSININHLEVYETLPLHHKDPFDRILIAQSISDNIPLISKDKIFKTYLSSVVW